MPAPSVSTLDAADLPLDAFQVRVQAEVFDASTETTGLVAGRTDVGAVVTFTGLCRADDQNGTPLAALTLEHYPGMAEEEMDRLLQEARTRWPLSGARLVHRYGRMVPGDPIVLVVTASAHRGAAFAAAEFLMDWLKTNAPFWKKEERPGTAADGTWVEAKGTDDAAADRWQKG
ncbi:molybdenum cofactor biosynthesis protein MoaE [Azorhizobium sp. AG788]|uniref:molybdenum cofactor biosynthesis protein MoaE n=1 Tax=Azorhizobium sp. AG788 TaxID=2183897 RepID=UPI003139E993